MARFGEEGMQHIFFVSSGLGFGNATRLLAIAEEMVPAQSQIHIHLCSWGATPDLWRGVLPSKYSVHELFAYKKRCFYLTSVWAYIANTFLLLGLRIRFRPKLVLLDSDYHFAAYSWRRWPLVFLGQSFDVLKRAKELRYKPVSRKDRFVFFLREKMDFQLQRLFCDLILVPSFVPRPAAGKVHPVPLIVRKGFRRDPARPDLGSGEGGIAAVDSGSGFGAADFSRAADRLQARPVSGHRQLNRAVDFRDVCAVLCRGGLSSLSECVALGKFCICMPLPGHPEQEINALTLQRLGLGIKLGGVDEAEKGIVLRSLRKHSQQPLPKLETNGSEVSARLLLSLLLADSAQNLASS